jgi:hypothetical protein
MRAPSLYVTTFSWIVKTDTRSTPGSVRTQRSRSAFPGKVVIRGPAPVMRIMKTPRVRSARVSGGWAPKTWSRKAAPTVSTTRVNAIPKRLMKV